MRTSVTSLRQIATLAAEYNQIPDQVQQCLELVRHCDHDLRNLIQLREKHAALLRQQAGAVERIDSVISAAHLGLDNMRRLVESCHPQAHSGRSLFRNKMRWVMVDGSDFRSQQPALSRHRAAVLAESQFVYRLTLESSSSKRIDNVVKEERFPVEAKMSHVFEDFTLLKELMGDATVSDDSPHTIAELPASPITSSEPSVTTNAAAAELSTNDYTLPQQPFAGRDDLQPKTYVLDSTMHHIPSMPPLIAYSDEKEVVATFLRHDSTTERVLLSSSDREGLSRLFDDDTEPTPYLSPYPPQASSFASVSQTSFDSKKVYAEAVPGLDRK